MAAPRLNIVLAQGPSKHPEKRGLEEDLCASLIMEPDLDVSIVPHLYHLAEEHTGTLFLRSLSGNFLLLSWLYPRAAFWVLSRAGIRGHLGETLLKTEEEDGETAFDRTPRPASASMRFRIGKSGASIFACSDRKSVV